MGRVEKTVDALKEYRGEVTYIAQRLESTLYKVTDLGGDQDKALKSREYHMENYSKLERPETNPKDDGHPSIEKIFKSIEKWEGRVLDADTALGMLGEVDDVISAAQDDEPAELMTTVIKPDCDGDGDGCDETFDTTEYMFIRLGAKILSKSGPDKLLTTFEHIIH